MGYSRKPKSKDDFLAEADAVPITEGLASTGFDTEGINRVIGREATITLTVKRKPWEDLDPNGRARNDFHVRLNDHDMAILRHLAEENEDLSMQKIIRRILVPELRRRVGL